MKGSTEEITFFKRIKIAIFELENYGNFLLEGLAPAIKYFFMLLLIASILISLFSTYNFSKMINKLSTYIQNELPNFTYENGVLKFDNNVDAYDDEYNLNFFVNTSDNVTENDITEYKNSISEQGIILLQNKVIIKYGTNNEIDETYDNIANIYGLNIDEILTKADLESRINKDSIPTLITMVFVALVITSYITSIITMISIVFIITILGTITSSICSLAFDIRHLIALSIYSISLSVVLTTVYSCAVKIKYFEIPYFDTVCFLISCIYIIAAMFMIKTDVIKQKQELAKIIEEQERVRKEKELEHLSNDKEKKNTEDKKENDKEKDENEDTEDETVIENKEPDGSEI